VVKKHHVSTGDYASLLLYVYLKRNNITGLNDCIWSNPFHNQQLPTVHKVEDLLSNRTAIFDGKGTDAQSSHSKLV